MFNLNITAQMVYTLLVGIVDRFGTHHKGSLSNGEGCAYVERVEGFRLVPSCIVGQVFADLGLLRVLLTGDAYKIEDEFGNEYGNCGNIRSLRERLSEFGITFDDEAFDLLVLAQREQDGDAPWGEVLGLVSRKVASNRWTS